MLIGKEIGDCYRLENKIGSGSFGEIYLGTNTENATKVAIKVVILNFAS